MKATCWMGKKSVEVRDVPDPQILNQRDAIVRITSTAICGSDLHLYNGFMPTMKKGDILGHEFMGEVMGSAAGSRTSRSATASSCRSRSPAATAGSAGTTTGRCARTRTPTPPWPKRMGHAASGAFGYSHLTGGFAGGQAEFARVPFADVGPLKIENGFSDEQVLFLSDILPTGYMGAEMCDIKPGDTVAVWGCGPVGLFAIKSAFLLGAERVIAIDRFDYRLEMAREKCGAETVNYERWTASARR